MKAPEWSLASFARDGFVGPVPILTRHECRTLRRHMTDPKRPPPADWHKGGAITDWLLYRLAASPRLLSILTPIIGDDIVLWGCSFVRRRAGDVHPWHVDIETSDAEGSYVTAWIGLENASSRSGLSLITGSHKLETVQQVQSEQSYRRGEAPTETVLAWAEHRNPDARLVQPEVGDGEAILFDGRLWHKSHNIISGTRSALVLQFAAASSPVRMLDMAQLEWPFRFVPAPRPPCIAVAGSVTHGPNRVIAPPAHISKRRNPMLSSCIRSLDLPLAEQEGGGWKPHPLFRGSTPILDEMSCHAAVLSPGHSPHAPHIHPHEELLIVLDGEAELVISDSPSADGARIERVRPGAFSYYPSGQHHTIRNAGATPIAYLMFKWQSDGAKVEGNPLATTIFRDLDYADPDNSKPFVTRKLFEQPTSQLGRLHCHTTWLAPGAGYEPHVDAYDVAILTLSGRVETLGKEVGPNSVVFYAAGEKHGMRNVGDTPARYLVFEFHAPHLDIRRRARRYVRPLAKRILRRALTNLGISRESIQ
jgi:mannose-6-phosphate isomerase-like protein (cupin superfamily)